MGKGTRIWGEGVLSGFIQSVCLVWRFCRFPSKPYRFSYPSRRRFMYCQVSLSKTTIIVLLDSIPIPATTHWFPSILPTVVAYRCFLPAPHTERGQWYGRDFGSFLVKAVADQVGTSSPLTYQTLHHTRNNKSDPDFAALPVYLPPSEHPSFPRN